jgi:hypothetical protein
MSNLRNFATVIFTTVLFVSCSNDDDTPEPINEEEVITTMTVTLVPDGDGTEVVLSFQDLDGDGPDAPDVNVSGSLATGATYNGSIVLLNETESPAEDITEEVKEEGLEHQFFYTIGAELDLTIEYANFDANLDNLGTEFTLTTGAESSGSLTFTLRHEPTKPNTGLVDAEGETDIEVAFDIEVVELG